MEELIQILYENGEVVNVQLDSEKCILIRKLLSESTEDNYKQVINIFKDIGIEFDNVREITFPRVKVNE